MLANIRTTQVYYFNWDLYRSLSEETKISTLFISHVKILWVSFFSVVAHEKKEEVIHGLNAEIINFILAC